MPSNGPLLGNQNNQGFAFERISITRQWSLLLTHCLKKIKIKSFIACSNRGRTGEHPFHIQIADPCVRSSVYSV